jgi:hypothetical protein
LVLPWVFILLRYQVVAVNRVVEKKSWVDTLGLRAFALFKERKMAIFFIFFYDAGYVVANYKCHTQMIT